MKPLSTKRLQDRNIELIILRSGPSGCLAVCQAGIEERRKARYLT